MIWIDASDKIPEKMGVMFFETRTSDAPEVSPELQELAQAFTDNNLAAAIAGEQQLRARNTELYALPGDVTLRIELLRASGRFRRSMALSRIARNLFPRDPAIQIYAVRLFLGSGRILDGIEYLKNDARALREQQPAIWNAEMASIQADAGFEKKAETYIECALEHDDSHPVVNYLLACAEGSLRRWEKALEYGRRTLDEAPAWTRARGMHIYTLLATGQREQAHQLIDQAEQFGSSDATLDFYALFSEMTHLTAAEAVTRFQAYLEQWPDCDFNASLYRNLLVAAAENGDDDLVRELLPEQSDSIRETLQEVDLRGSRSTQIHLPLVAQKRDECVPTSVAMILYPQGVSIDPTELYDQMQGRHGIRLWRMRDWLQSNGYHFQVIDFDRENVETVLSRNIPLLGLVEGFLLSHVDVLCGFNRDLDLLYVRDPMTWMTFPLTIEEFSQRHASAPFLYLIVTAGEYRKNRVIYDNLNLSAEGEALVDLMEAGTLGQRQRAEQAFAKITADHVAYFSAICHGNRVICTPREFIEAQEQIVADEDMPLSIRFQALTRLNSRESEQKVSEIIETDELKLAPGGIKFVQLFQEQNAGNAARALELCDSLLGLGSPSAYLWTMRAALLQDLGRLDEALLSLENAIEIEPANANTRQQLLKLGAGKNLLSSDIVELRNLLDTDPDNKTLIWMLAEAESMGADGLKYEQTLREHLKYFPRDPEGWFTLINWFLFQRNDWKVQQTSAEAAELLPEDEAPKFHLPPSEDDAEQSNPETGESADEERPVDELEVPDLLDRFSDGSKEESEAAREELQRRDEQGDLLWHEAASFRGIYLARCADEVGIEKLPAQILATPEPGVLFQTVSQVAWLTASRFQVSPLVAQTITRWIARCLPDFRSDSDIWFNFILLKEAEGELEIAREELESLHGKFPGNSSAIYRLGVIRSNQGRLQEAMELFRDCLDLDPGLPGAMDELANVATQLNDVVAMAEATLRLTCKYPYRYAHAADYISNLVENGEAEKAQTFCQSVQHRFQPEHQVLLRASLCLAQNEYQEAWEMLQPLEINNETEEELFEDYLRARVRSALLSEDREKILQVCDFGLGRWPDSANLLKIKGNELAESDPEQARELFRAAIDSGFADGQTCFNYLHLVENPVQAAREILTGDIDASFRDHLTGLFCSVFAQPRFVPDRLDYLLWARKKFPEHPGVPEALVEHYISVGDQKMAANLATELYEQYPNDPYYSFLRGRATVDQNPKGALKFLKRAYDQNKSTEVIFNLARCHHALGNRDQARSLHRENLQRQPLYSSSLTNLHILGETDRELWPYINPILENFATGFDDEYFLVVAVKTAKATGNQVHPNWLSCALDRYEVLQARQGYRSENSELKKALKAWLKIHPIPDHPLKPRFPWLVERTWPGTAWVPKQIPI